MHPFTSAALLLVPSETYEHDDTRMKRVLMFLFGALDALIQQIAADETQKFPCAAARGSFRSPTASVVVTKNRHVGNGSPAA